MRRESCILAALLVGVLALLGSPASAQFYSQQHSRAQVDVGTFYDGLAPYGDWIEMPNYGWSWAPRVERGWRPYTRGQWVMTDDGWFWDSDEKFGWAAYHYGRWVNDPYYGWVWVPGTEWAPAWVSWRHGNGYTGWAPLPPRATWQTHVGLNIGGIDIDAFIGARDYAFVQDRAFVDRGVYQRLLPPTQNVTIINVTNNVTNYTVVDQRVVNGGIAVANVERAVGRRVPRARTIDVDRADVPRRARANEVAVFRPEVRPAPERRPAQGRSLVKGEEPPPLLVERRKRREQELQQEGNQPELTAKDVEQQRPAAQPRDQKQNAAGQPQTPPTNAKAVQQQETQRARDQARQDADKRSAKEQAQQATDQKLAREQAQQDAAKQRAKDQAQQATDQKLAREQAQQDAAKQRAKDQEQQRLDREKRLAIDQQQRNQQKLDAQAQADKRAKDAQLASEQKQSDQRQRNQQQADQQRAKRESDAKAQADKRAKDAQQAKDNPKDKGKKNPKASPTPPPPAGQEQ
jgi:hypothetical protein